MIYKLLFLSFYAFYKVYVANPVTIKKKKKERTHYYTEINVNVISQDVFRKKKEIKK